MPVNEHNPIVTLVIPARDAEATIKECLDAVLLIRDAPGSPLARIIVVDDGSTDGTVAEAKQRGVEVLESGGKGAGAARNVGLAATTTPLIWFVDSDCVASPDALDLLLPHLDDSMVAGVGGSYGIAPGASLLERLIHEEIMVRHEKMPTNTDFLATFNVVYRTEVIRDLGGFDVRYLKGQDAELAFRVMESGHRLRFDRRSIVRHHHADRLGRYLRVQRQQGYWRVALHLEHRGHGTGDSYSNLMDHLQPVLAATLPASLLLLFLPWGWIGPSLILLLLLIMQIPMAGRMVARQGTAMLVFAPLGAIRAVWRATGMVLGVIDRILGRGAMGERSSTA